jgi:TolA-binding protein
MAFLCRVLLFLSLLVVGGEQLFAAGSREQRTYAAACAAFEDKFYDRAENGLLQFLQNYRKSTNAPEAVLLLSQAEYYLGKFPAAVAHLTDTNNLARAQAAGLADHYVYWTAEARFASGDLKGAADTFVLLAERFPRSTFGLNAVVEAAAAYGKLGDWPAADRLLDNPNGLFQRMAQLDPASVTVADGRLLQAEAKYRQGNFGAAIAVLKLMDPALLTLEQDWKRAYWLCRADLGTNDLAAALAATTNLLQIAQQGQGDGWGTNLAESVVLHASLLERDGQLAAAISAWEGNLSPSAPVEEQRRAILKTVDLAMAQNNLAAAEEALEAYLPQFPPSAPADLARLTLGELYLKDFIAHPTATNQLAAAQTQFLAALTNGPLAGKVFLNRGWCDWLWAEVAAAAGDATGAAQWTTTSLSDFQAAAALLPMSEDLAVAKFKWGDAQFRLGHFEDAQTNYQAVLTDFSAFPNVANSLGSGARYQILRTRLALRDKTLVDDSIRQVLEDFLKGAPADNSLLLAGEGYAEFDSPAKAREVFQKIEDECTNSPLLPWVAFATARTFERETNWLAAVTNYSAWLQAYPTNELRPQVEYAHHWAVYQSGDEAKAYGLFTNFISRYTNSFTPLALWWVADHYFRLGTNYTDAEKNYQVIFQNFPTNELANRARLMAGRAALGRSGYPDAKKYFLTLINTNNADEDLRDQARFGYCETAIRQISITDTNNANLQEVTNILAQMTPKSATNIVGALAWCETGDCDLQLGAFDSATNAYAQAFNSPAASLELVCQAKVGFGVVLEKKAAGLPASDGKVLLREALDQYLDVVYLNGNDFWIKKAGLNALPLIGLLDSGDAAADKKTRLYNRLEELLPAARETLEKKRAVALKN